MGSFLPHPDSLLRQYALFSKVSKALTVPAATEGSLAPSRRHYLWGYISKPGGVNAKILAISATLGAVFNITFL